MSCVRVSLLVNVTWLPRGTVMLFGLTPADVMMITFVGVGGAVGDVLLLLHAAATAQSVTVKRTFGLIPFVSWLTPDLKVGPTRFIDQKNFRDRLNPRNHSS